MKLINWNYCRDPNMVNEAIMNLDENWEGLDSAEKIISITWDGNHGAYVVFWENEYENQEGC